MLSPISLAYSVTYVPGLHPGGNLTNAEADEGSIELFGIQIE